MQRQSVNPVGWVLTLVALGVTPSACGSSNPPAPFGSDTGGVSANAGGAAGTAGSLVGSGGFGTFAAGGSAGAAACKKESETCALSSDCCGNAVCNTNTPAAELLGCHAACKTAADCPSGCCMPYGMQSGFCADAKWCACGTDGSQCGSMQPACCTTHVCLQNQAATGFECKKLCQANTDCPTSCCVAIPNTTEKACLDPVYCPAP